MSSLIQDNRVVGNKKREQNRPVPKPRYSANLSDNSDDEVIMGSFGSEDRESLADSVTYRSNIQVTFHHRDLFMSTFSEYFTSMTVIEKSLSPEKNRD